ncbi:hybrid sensor histidine kinase/response regulator [Phenylobacterium montanum]|uniref:histidine kinase n=1 Tax=Phenylobacterium montanum TaxID=2823693 RepID=A0A975FYM1_9CAUL|nr:ATP-binding protein [Caulobacter sp. S6]QUD87685.1 response regulator [Caulobacter sp. S6]
MKLLAVGLAVFAMALASMTYTRFGGRIACLWLANSITVAAMLRSPPRRWVWLLLVTTLGNAAAKVVAGSQVPLSFGTSFASSLEALICAALTLRWCGPAIDISRPRHLAIFSAVGVLLATPVSAIAGSAIIWVARGTPVLEGLASWWRIDALGLLIGGPMLLALTPEAMRELWGSVRTGRGALSAGLLALALVLTCSHTRYPLAFLVPPALILLAFELNVAGAAVALAISALVMVGYQLARIREEAAPPWDAADRLFLLQVFLAVMTAMVLPVATALASRRRLESQLREALSEAQAASVAKGDFLANMSHEIRTPLTAIIGFSGLLESTPDLPAQAELYVERISRSGRALLSIVNDILDFSRMEAGQVTLAPRAIDPEILARETLDLVAEQAAAKGLDLRLETSGRPGFVEADGERLQQVLLNLVTNAVKFTPRGSVTVRLERDGERLRLAVTDTGVGVPQAVRQRLFERFWQVDNSSTRLHGGTGLGLAICKSLVELMGGEIGVEGREGEGSTFWFVVPAPAAQPAPAPDEAEDIDGLEVGSAHILVVDDVAANRELVRAMLAALGHSLVEAEGGAEAVEAAARERFDVILMDMQMPGMDGLAATRAIRSASPLNAATPILALSANVLPAQVAHCLEAGMDDHLAKPIAPLELLQKIAQWSRARSSAAPSGQAA